MSRTHPASEYFRFFMRFVVQRKGSWRAHPSSASLALRFLKATLPFWRSGHRTRGNIWIMLCPNVRIESLNFPCTNSTPATFEWLNRWFLFQMHYFHMLRVALKRCKCLCTNVASQIESFGCFGHILVVGFKMLVQFNAVIEFFATFFTTDLFHFSRGLC